MKNNIIRSVVIAGALSLTTFSGANAGGATAQMLADTCAGCHGTDGASGGPASPSIAGLSSPHFVEMMQDYKSGKVPSTIMGRIAKGYEDDEFEKMAGYFAQQSFPTAKQPFDAKLAEKGGKLHEKYCHKCHHDGGSEADDDAGILAGQWKPYIQWSLVDFNTGDRQMIKKMKKKMKKLMSKEGEKGIDALVEFYASQQY